MGNLLMSAPVTTAGPPPTPTWDFGLLTLSVLVMIFSLLLLQEANKTAKWLFPDMPNPDSGEDWSYFVLLVVPVAWVIWLSLSRPHSSGFWVGLLNVFLFQPRQMAVGFVMAGFVPLALAVFKLVTIATAGYPRAEAATPPPRPRLVPIVQAFFALANVAASAVILLKATA